MACILLPRPEIKITMRFIARILTAQPCEQRRISAPHQTMKRWIAY